MPRLLTVRTVALIFGASPRTIQRWIDSDNGTFVIKNLIKLPSGGIRIPSEEVDRAIEAFKKEK